MNKTNLFLDTETTGITKDDEIISIALVNAQGNVLLNSFVKPTRHTKWPSAMAHNHITPEFIFSGNFPTIDELADQILAIVQDQDVVAYGMRFDAEMLENSNIDLRANARVHCAMNRFSIWHGIPSTKPYHVTGYKAVSLSVAAEMTGHIWTGQAHSALPDAEACRYVWQWLDKQGK